MRSLDRRIDGVRKPDRTGGCLMVHRGAALEGGEGGGCLMVHREEGGGC